MKLTFHSNKDKEIANLKMQLESSRLSVMHLSKIEIPEWYSYNNCNSREDTYSWKGKIVQEIIDVAQEETSENIYGQKIYYGRAICPLCGDWPNNEHGYTMPEGLLRHLEGIGNVLQCVVMENLFGMARDCWNEKFRQKEIENILIDRKNNDQRLKSETLILVAPGYPPELFDDRYELGSTKNQKQHLNRLIWAEKRLKDLGFSIQVLNNIKSFTKEYDEFVVFADPRRKGLIGFDVYKKPLPKKIINGKHASTKFIGEFDIRDAWKHDLISKFEQRVKNLHI